jgi:hypothetical protein
MMSWALLRRRRAVRKSKPSEETAMCGSNPDPKKVRVFYAQRYGETQKKPPAF